MGFKLDMAVKEAENNVYEGVDLLKGTIVFLWTLLCLFVINKSRSLLWATVFGGAYYLSLVALCIVFFKGINKYLSFPKENSRMPVFIRHKLDTLFIYPIILMSFIGITSNLLIASGIFPAPLQQLYSAGSKSMEVIPRMMLLPLAAFAEELLNMLIVSFFYTNMKVPRSFRLIGSMLAAALVFGTMHSFGWGFNAAISIGIAYFPVFFVTLFTGNIWISFLAHLYNNLISLTKVYYGSYSIIVIAVISIIPAVWAIRTLFRRTR